MKTTIEKYAEAKYMVSSTPPYPVRIGHIVGARRVYLAEAGPVSLGYFKTIKAAARAIADAADK